MWLLPFSATVTIPTASQALVLVPLAGRDENTAPLPLLLFVIVPPPPRTNLPVGHVAVDVPVSVPAGLLGPPVVADAAPV